MIDSWTGSTPAPKPVMASAEPAPTFEPRGQAAPLVLMISASLARHTFGTAVSNFEPAWNLMTTLRAALDGLPAGASGSDALIDVTVPVDVFTVGLRNLTDAVCVNAPSAVAVTPATRTAVKAKMESLRTLPPKEINGGLK